MVRVTQEYDYFILNFNPGQQRTNIETSDGDESDILVKTISGNVILSTTYLMPLSQLLKQR